MIASPYKKVIYIAILLVLVVLLYTIGRPARIVQNEGERQQNAGGLLAQYRADQGLAEAQVGEIDPASSAVKLATFGMRGIAISMLWHQTMERQKRHNWNEVVATANQIIFLEPHFITIWDFLGWTLAYNASAEFDDYRERYRWVIRGIDFLITGVKKNQKAPKLYKNAGWTISQKIGIADEVEQYRRLLKDDEDFGMRNDCPLPSDRDNWLLGRRWYHQGEQLVLDGISLGNESDFIFFANSRLNMFNYAKWVRRDGIFGEPAIKAWDNALAEWKAFGQMELNTAIPDDGTMRMTKTNKSQRTKMETTDIVRAEEKALLEELNAIEPSLKETLIIERWRQLGETPGQQGSLMRLLKEAPELTSTFQPIEELRTIRKWLDKSEPGWQNRLTQDRNTLIPQEESANRAIPIMFLPEEDRAVLTKTDEEISQVQSRSLENVKLSPRILSEEIQELNVPRESKSRARAIVAELGTHQDRKRLSDLFRGILNYEQRFREVSIERTHQADDAHHLRYDARKTYYAGKLNEAVDGWIAAMKKWDELIDMGEIEKLANDTEFIRDNIDIVEKFLILLDDSNKIFSDISADPVPLRRIMWYRVFRESGGAEDGKIALEYAKKGFEQAKAETDGSKRQELLEKSEEHFLKVAQHFAGINAREKFLEYAPFFDIRDQTLEAIAYYLKTRDLQGKPLPEPMIMRPYVELMLQHDPAVASANELLINAIPLLQEQKYDEGLAALDKAVAAWQFLLEKYPIIALDPTNAAYIDVSRLAAQYAEVLRAQEKPVPEEFSLKKFLRP